ncbi:L,D-transpeptidase [uncultured Shimia sp.]|uniref:L,D-transpeptidase n=1 Tax=uncultured Shimia sp. TaxID=573152 RepID=UPI0026234D49|nr:L,D-transpeptidase [uncultured Shimia sp.]
MKPIVFRAAVLMAGLALLSACASQGPNSATPKAYDVLTDGEITLPAVPNTYLEPPNRRAEVAYNGSEEPGTIVVDPHAKFLYFVEEDGQATRYPIAVGIEGRAFRGSATVNHSKEWPSWAPTKNMLRSEPEVYGPFAGGIPGGVASPLGARALYLYRGGKDTRYRIHGTNDMESIGNANTAGCIRLFNQDIIHLAERTPNGTAVVVRTYEDSVALEGEELANRGVELPPKIVDPDVVAAAVVAQEAG